MVHHPKKYFEAGEEICCRGTPVINSKYAALDLIYSRDDLTKRDSLFLLYVDKELRLIKFLQFKNVSINKTDSELTKIIEFGLTVRATGLLIVELHLFRDPWPRGENDQSFLKLQMLASETDIYLLDFLVITPGNVRPIITRSAELSAKVLR